jgi:hypothetical protein
MPFYSAASETHREQVSQAPMDTHRDSTAQEFESAGFNRYVPLLVYAVTILVLLLIPLKIISYDYLPIDDALRHAGKALSGKSWPEIVVLNDTYQMDHNFGWHLFLGEVAKWFHLDVDGLLVFSLVLLFVVMAASPLIWLKRPEAWLIALLFAAIIEAFPQRAMFGRPFLLTEAVLLTVLFLWQSRCPSGPTWKTVAGLSALIAVAVFVHGIWYLWLLPITAFFLAREYRWGLALAAACLIGTAVGASFTGHPVDYVMQATRLALHALGKHQIQRTQVTELRPASISPFIFLALGSLLVLRRLAGLKTRPMHANPLFWLVCIGLLLSQVALRFWIEWGFMALMALVAIDAQALLEKHMAAGSWKRAALSLALALSTYMAFTSDVGNRWTYNLTKQYLTQDDPELKGWLTDKGGIFYSSDMRFFYDTFWKNPKADWRYILGFDPTSMPEEDFKTLCGIIWNFGDIKAYEPWVKKMRMEDRLVLRGTKDDKPAVAELEWKYAVTGVWIGRLPRATGVAPQAPGTVEMPRPANGP